MRIVSEILFDLNVLKYHSIALKEFYLKSFKFNSIKLSVWLQNRREVRVPLKGEMTFNENFFCCFISKDLNLKWTGVTLTEERRRLIISAPLAFFALL